MNGSISAVSNLFWAPMIQTGHFLEYAENKYQAEIKLIQYRLGRFKNEFIWAK